MSKISRLFSSGMGQGGIDDPMEVLPHSTMKEDSQKREDRLRKSSTGTNIAVGDPLGLDPYNPLRKTLG